VTTVQAERKRPCGKAVCSWASMYRVALPEEAPFDLRDSLIDKLDSPLPVTKLWHYKQEPQTQLSRGMPLEQTLRNLLTPI
jgi:hypothetical protein